MDIACFIPLHFYQHQHHHHQDSGSLALSRTDWHSNNTDTCLLVNSPTPAYSSKSENKKRSIYQQQTLSSFELSRTKRQCQQQHQHQQDMQPRRRSSTTSRPTTTNRRRSSQQRQQRQQNEQQQQQQYPSNQHQQSPSSSSSTLPVITSPDVATVNSIEDDLHHLRDEWATIDIVFHSLRNAFTIQPLETATEEHLDDVDRELSIAYDDLKAQVRHLERSLHRLDAEISPFRSPQTTASSSSAITTSAAAAAAAPTAGGMVTETTSPSTKPKKKHPASSSSPYTKP